MMTATPIPGATGEQTTLITNENEAFALEPLDTTHMTGGKDLNLLKGLLKDTIFNIHCFPIVL